MVDFDQHAVAGARAGPADDTLTDRQHVGTAIAGEVEALVKSLLAVEGIHALAKIGGNVAAQHGSAGGTDLGRELAPQQDVFQRIELRGAKIEAAIELVQHRGKIRHLRATAAAGLRATEGRVAIEVELAAAEVRHLGEALAQRLEADPTSVPQTPSHGPPG